MPEQRRQGADVESMPNASAPAVTGLPVPRVEPVAVTALVDRAIDRYLAGCHARVEAFVDRHFSLRGTLRLHRHALGWDLLRAPANAALIGVFVLMQLTASLLPLLGLRRAGRWLGGRAPFLTTDVARALTWAVQTELLDLPFEDEDRRWAHDALAVEIVGDPALAPLVASAAAVTQARLDPTEAARLISVYADARNAAADLFNNAVFAGAGAAAFKQLTLGALSLGPLIAGAIAHQAAVAAFPLGAGLGGLWYSVFTVKPTGAAIALSTAGLIGIAAVLTAFVGIVTDPVLRGLGVHRRRLHRLIDTLGQRLRGRGGAAFHVRDYYVARVFDLVDVVRTGLRAAG